MNYVKHLKSAYPELTALFDQVGHIPELEDTKLPVAEAITKIVIGQMLSRTAARSIYGRIVKARDSQGLGGSWKLSAKDLADSGLSKRKVRTIKEFGERYDDCPAFYESWRIMSFEELSREVDKHWGLSQWSASVLALFYFGNCDVFPATDGSIKRVMSSLKRKGIVSSDFDINKASPYRSYLALFLWAMLDSGLI